MQCLQEPSNISKLLNHQVNHQVQRVTKIPEVPITQPTNSVIHSTQVNSHPSVSIPQQQITSINQHRPITSIHHQRQSSHLNNAIINSIIPPQRKLNHSQSVLNIFSTPQIQQVHRNTMEVPKQISAQSLIHVKSPPKNINQQIKQNEKHSTQLYPKKLDTYRVQESYSKNKPLEFKTSGTKPKVTNNHKVVTNTKNQVINFTPHHHHPHPQPHIHHHPNAQLHPQSKIVESIQNNNVSLKSRPKSNTHLHRNPNLVKITPTKRDTSPPKSPINPKHNLINKPELITPILNQHSNIQFHQERQKVS